MNVIKLLGVAVGAWLATTGCASQWKIHGGPQECRSMCASWEMDLVGMVGVGSQSRVGAGATACVCEVPRAAGGARVDSGGTGVAASTGAVAVMLAEQARQNQTQPRQSARASPTW